MLPVQSETYTDFQGLQQLKNVADHDSPETLKKVAEQFEALFMQMMLKSMRSASLGEGLFDSDHSKMYQDLFDKQIALSMSKQNGLGIANMLMQQMQPKSAKAISLNELNAVESAENKKMEFSNPEGFVKKLYPIAQLVAKESGLSPKAIVAQAALETGWGKFMIQQENGQSSFNLFGIKADSQWSGDVVKANTLEFDQGVMTKKTEYFRAYESYEASLKDYVNLMTTNQRYQGVAEAGTNDIAYVEALGRSGYATDPEYGQKIKGVMSSKWLGNIETKSSFESSTSL